MSNIHAIIVVTNAQIEINRQEAENAFLENLEITLEDFIKKNWENAVLPVEVVISVQNNTIIFANGYDDLDHIYKSIIYHNKQLGDPKLRLTTDVVITNVNKLLSRFAKRKNIL